MIDKWVEQHATRTPEQYAERVRWVAIAHFLLFTASLAVIILIASQEHLFMTLGARSNADTAVFVLIFILGAYYLITSFRGFLGALRLLRWSVDRRDRERRKHTAIKVGDETRYVCFDQAIRVKGQPDKPIRWEIGDEAGKLGELEIDGVTATYYPLKAGMNNALFEFLVDKLDNILEKHDPRAHLQIVQWSSIDDDRASTFRNRVQAFQNLGSQLNADAGRGEDSHSIWPTVEITPEDVAEIEGELRKLVPSLRDEALLPRLEFQVEYNVPVIPEPLAFLRLTRKENRADPLVSVGCSAIVMLFVLLVLVVFVVVPPWIPSR